MEQYKKINSHVQISKCLLKPFSHKTEEGLKVWCLDLKSNQIREERINKLDTIYAYYDEDVEKILENAETAFGDIARKIKDFESKKINITISKNEIDIIFKFIDYVLLRNEQIANILREDSYFLENNSSHSEVIRYCEIGEPIKILRGYQPNILVNKTNTDFIIARNVLYIEKMKGREIYLMPIAPKVAIILLPIELNNTYVKDGILEHAETTEVNLIQRLNNTAYYTEREASAKFIVGSKAELERIRLLNYNENDKK